MKNDLIAYIHIGLEKTGTTTIQEFAYLNRDILLEDNIYYPTSPGIKNHTNLPTYAYDKNLNDLAVRKNVTNENERIYFRNKFEESFKKEIEPISQKGTNLLVSSEHLSSRVGDESEIRKLLVLFKQFGYKPKIILYLRRQDQFLLSTYSTWVKCGNSKPLNLQAYKNRRYNYLEQLKLWENAVGTENIILGLFDSNRLLNGDLIDDFCNKINVNPERYKAPLARHNSSLSSAQIAFLKKFNTDIPELIEGVKNPLRGEIIEALEAIEDPMKLSLPQENLIEIYEYFRSDNEKIKSNYFPKMETPLFSPPKFSNENLYDKTEYVNEIQKISNELWQFQQTRINKQALRNTDQHAKINKLETENLELRRANLILKNKG